MLQFPITMKGHVEYLENFFENSFKVDGKSVATTYIENKGEEINIIIIGKGSHLIEAFKEISHRQIEERVPLKIIIKLENYLKG